MPEPTGQPDRPATSSAQRQYEHRVGVTFTVNAPDANLAVSAVKRVLSGAQLIGLTVHSPQREALILSWRLAGSVADPVQCGAPMRGGWCLCLEPCPDHSDAPAPAPAADPTGPDERAAKRERLARAVAVALAGDFAATDPPTPSAYAAADAALAVINGRDDVPAEPTAQQRAAEDAYVATVERARTLCDGSGLPDDTQCLAFAAAYLALHADVERLTALAEARQETIMRFARETRDAEADSERLRHERQAFANQWADAVADVERLTAERDGLLAELADTLEGSRTAAERDAARAEVAALRDDRDLAVAKRKGALTECGRLAVALRKAEAEVAALREHDARAQAVLDKADRVVAALRARQDAVEAAVLDVAKDAHEDGEPNAGWLNYRLRAALQGGTA